MYYYYYVLLLFLYLFVFRWAAKIKPTAHDFIVHLSIKPTKFADEYQAQWCSPPSHHPPPPSHPQREREREKSVPIIIHQYKDSPQKKNQNSTRGVFKYSEDILFPLPFTIIALLQSVSPNFFPADQIKHFFDEQYSWAKQTLWNMIIMHMPERLLLAISRPINRDGQIKWKHKSSDHN